MPSPYHRLRAGSPRSTGALPPVVILGGSANALSVARSLGRRNIRVHVSVSAGRHALFSRYCTKRFPLPRGVDCSDFWMQLLCGPRSDALRGSVILTCNDEAVAFVARHRQELSEHYILDDSTADVQLAMLDKCRTLTLARAVNVDAPGFWPVERPEQLDALEGELRYPLIVKPFLSHLFQARFGGRKYLTVANLTEARAALERVWESGLQAMLSEWIPGPDHALASYYTYIDRSGTPLFHFTKKVIRRFPKNEGLTSYHITDWDPEVAELGLRFLTGVNFRGLANVEFKRDVRDGRLRLVECNPRFTAPQELFVRCGLDTASLVYDQLVGLPAPKELSYKRGVRLWYPVRDFHAYRQLRSMNELTFSQWIKSVCHWQALPFLRLSDPMPTIMPAARAIGARLHLL